MADYAERTAGEEEVSSSGLLLSVDPLSGTTGFKLSADDDSTDVAGDSDGTDDSDADASDKSTDTDDSDADGTDGADEDGTDAGADEDGTDTSTDADDAKDAR